MGHRVRLEGLSVVSIPVGRITAGHGAVAFRPFRGATPAQVRQMRAYVRGCNQALLAGYLSPTGRVSTGGELRRQASRAARRERRRAERELTPYGDQVAGHVPDTTWTGNPVPFGWMPLDAAVNESLGSQAERYPVGFKPTCFIYQPRDPTSGGRRDPPTDHGVA